MARLVITVALNCVIYVSCVLIIPGCGGTHYNFIYLDETKIPIKPGTRVIRVPIQFEGQAPATEACCRRLDEEFKRLVPCEYAVFGEAQAGEPVRESPCRQLPPEATRIRFIVDEFRPKSPEDKPTCVLFLYEFDTDEMFHSGTVLNIGWVIMTYPLSFSVPLSKGCKPVKYSAIGMLLVDCTDGNIIAEDVHFQLSDRFDDAARAELAASFVAKLASQ